MKEPWQVYLKRKPTEHLNLKDCECCKSSVQAIQVEIQSITDKLKQSKINLKQIDIYVKKFKILRIKKLEFEEINETYNAIFERLRVKKQERVNTFKVGFDLITDKLKETYQYLTQGGDAELEYVNSSDPFSEGILFTVRPPKKSWKNIGKLSGGERTLSSLSLIFALHYFKPNPIYIMDEIDAALDYKNVSIVASYIKEKTKEAQFIVISLRNKMFEIANILIGIYKNLDTTQSVYFNPGLYSNQNFEQSEQNKVAS